MSTKRAGPLRVNPRIEIPAAELTWSFARSSGPGGQNVQKVNSKAVLRFAAARSQGLPLDVRERFLTRYRSRLTTEGDLVIASDRYRDQGRNVADCLARLQSLVLAVATAPRRRRATRPSRASVENRLAQKQLVARKKSQRRQRPEEG